MGIVVDEELTERLERLEANVESASFRQEAQAFEAALKEVKSFARTDREALWARYQKAWDRRKAHLERRRFGSEVALHEYKSRVFSLDVEANGASVFGLPAWGPVAGKVRAAKDEIKRIRAEARETGRLTKEHRDQLWELLDDAWRRVENQEDTLRHVHGERANELFNEAHSAVEHQTWQESIGTLKANTNEFHSLSLSRSQRELLKEGFDELWTRWKMKREAGQEAHRERQRDHLAHLRDRRERMSAALDRVRENNLANEERLRDARSPDFAERVEGWLTEGQEKERTIESDLEALDDKIAEISQRLGE